MKKRVTVIALLLSFITSSVLAQDEKKAIEKAILNYVEAFYEADTSKAYESIIADLAKRGYYQKGSEVVEAKMSFEQLVRLAKRWKASQNITPESPKRITVFDVLDKIATAKVEALWGIDYFHLAKVNGKWMIINVLWQDYPKKS
ncbi:MAG TPA: nuclear transport factor 2 family protein [Flavisolibacter sp.]|nr:nuclear transport factor 2 family protein [Flavisolibacter sp.]